jgi:tRNA (cmo5U34)-methyltransferase
MNMDKVKHHFESEAPEFDRTILTLIPHYPEMVRALVGAIPFDSSFPLRAIDLGCGTGTVAAKILENFPNAHITCLDLAENMIAIAQQRLARYPLVNYVVADLSAYEFTEKYDAVLSSLALHHLPTNKDKQTFYRRIYESLNPGGVFYNADVVLASNEYLQSVYGNEWRRFMAQHVSTDEIDGKWIPKSQEEDRPAKLMDQIEWMAKIGFVEMDVLWKYYGFAVYGGVRP